MRKHPFGPRRVPLPVIGQGTRHLEDSGHDAAVLSLMRGIALGLTHIDTAETYGCSAIESFVADAIEGRRDEVFLVSQVQPSNASYEGTIQACEESLLCLKTYRLDCYLLPWPSPHPLEETIGALELLLLKGKIRSWGVTNFDVPDLERAEAIAGRGKIACNRVLYHLEKRTIEHRVLPWCERHGVSVVGYSPFGSGSFLGANSQGAEVLRQIAVKHGVTPRAVALAFLVRKPSLFTIPNASDLSHIEENARGGKLDLSADELARIDAAFPLEPEREGLS